jgi:demethylmenaquinone methyltransferase / 2-methoxy-6-polyprenyl-1,4-benzoquinol methylase
VGAPLTSGVGPYAAGMAPTATPLPQGTEKATAVRGMFDAIAPRYDLVNRVMTFGLDRSWRRTTVAALGLPAGSVVLDLATGTGDLCAEAERQGLTPIGIDLALGMLQASHAAAPRAQGDITRLPLPDEVADGAVCGFALRNVVSLDDLFAELARTLRPGGRIGLLEVDRPDNPAIRFGHHLYFDRIVPVIGGLLSDRDAYRYLPASTAYLPPRLELLERLGAAGFEHIEHRRFLLGASQLITATRT